MIHIGSGLSWHSGLLLALPFLIAFGWAPGHWPVAMEGSASLSAGNIALQFALDYLAVFSLYSVLRSIVSRNTAFWAALFLGLNPWFLNSLSQAGGRSLACALAAAAFLTWAAKAERWTFLMILAGAVFAASVNAHVFSLTYLPILFLIFLYVNHEQPQHSVKTGSALFVAGGVLGGLFLFDGQGLSQAYGNFMQLAVGGSHNNFAEALYLAQLPATYYLHIMTALWLLSSILLFKAKGRYSGFAATWLDSAARPYGFCLSLCFVYGLILMTIEGGMGWSILAHSSLSLFGVPLACIGMAGILERCAFTDERCHRHSAALFLVLLTLVSYPSFQSFLMGAGMDQGMGLIFWIACLTLLLQLPAMQKFQTRRAAVIALILLAGFFLTGYDNPVWKKSGGADSIPQLTQVNETLYE